MIEAVKNLWRMGKFLPLLISDKEITVVPKKRVDIDNIGEIYMSDQTWHVIKESGLNFERATITYDPGDDSYLITSRAGGSGSLRPMGIRSNVANEALHITTDGRVGANTQTPSSKLAVSGQIEINPISASAPMVIGDNATGVQVDGLNAEQIGGLTEDGVGSPIGTVYYSDLARTTYANPGGETTTNTYNNTGSIQIVDGEIIEIGVSVLSTLKFNASQVFRIKINGTNIFQTDGSTYNLDGSFARFAVRFAAQSSGNTYFAAQAFSSDAMVGATLNGAVVNVADLSTMSVTITVQGTSTFNVGGVYITKIA